MAADDHAISLDPARRGLAEQAANMQLIASGAGTEDMGARLTQGGQRGRRASYVENI